MAPFPTTLSEAKELVASWTPLGLWSGDETRTASAGGDQGTAGSGHSSRRRQSGPSLLTGDAPAEVDSTSPAMGTDTSPRNVKILVAVSDSDGSAVRRGGLDKNSSTRDPRHSFDTRRLSIASGNTGRSSNGVARRRGNLETYIIVKPPAATAKHPLNLQIQLVVRQSRPRAASHETDQSQPDMGSDYDTSRTPTPLGATSHDLGATPMSRSRSDTTSHGESTNSKDISTRQRRAGSIKSTLSSDTSASSQLGGSRKRVEPMFNLAVHNVMQPTVVTDAATDAKVAKFMKRSVDILGVGSLEPTEYWALQRDSSEQYPRTPTQLLTTTTSSRSRDQSSIHTKSPSLAVGPTRSTENLKLDAAAERSSKRHSFDVSALRLDKGSQEGTAKKLLGRLFKKRPVNDQSVSSALGAAQSGSAIPGIVHGRLSRHSSRASHTSTSVPAVYVRPPGIDESAFSDGIQQPASAIGHATFGTSPQIACSINPTIEITSGGAIGGLATISTSNKEPHRSTTTACSPHLANSHPFPLIPSSRALGYSWTVHKWAKKKTDAWTAQIDNNSAIGQRDAKAWEHGTDEIVFEWIKVRLAPDGLPPEISKQLLLAGAKPTIISTARAAHLHSIPMRPPSLSTTESATHDDDQRSDAPSHDHESDSQTSHSVSRISVVEESESASDHTYDSGAETDPEDSETPWSCSLWVRRTGERIHLATLTPAPHHPKVIGILKIPFGLKPVNLGFEIEQTERSNDAVGYIGLSEENLKDVICVTAMWMVAREEFGGVGRRRRA